MILGVDRYHGDASFDWAKLKAAGVEWEYSKATDGASYVDHSLSAVTELARAAGVLTAAYHFFRANDSGPAQLNNFTASTAGVKFDLPHFFDWEGASVQGQTPSTQVMRAQYILDGMEALNGKVPVIYWGHEVLVELAPHLPESFAKYPIVIARYGCAQSLVVPILPFTKLFGWQDTDSAVIDGIPAGHTVDRDYFFGSLDELKAFAG